MDERSKNVLKFLKKDFEEKRGEKNLGIINEYFNEIETSKLNNDEVDALVDCYKVEYDDSCASLNAILAYDTLTVSALALLVSFISLILSFSNASFNTPIIVAGLLFSISVVAGLIICIIKNCKKIIRISRENAKFRNKIIATKIYLVNMKGKNSNEEII